MKGVFLFVLLVLCTAAVGQTTFTDYVIVDSFTVSSLLVVTYDTDDPFVPTLPFTQQVFKNTAGTTILGGQRDNSITITSAPTGASAYSNTVNNDVFSISTPTFGTGISILQYDGFDNAMTLDITTGLGTVDFTAGGLANQLHVQIGSDVDTLMTVQLYSGAATGQGINDYCHVDIAIPGATPLNIQDIFYNLDFSVAGFLVHGTGCDFTRIRAVQVITQMQDSCDAVIGIVSSYGPVPSPSPTISETPSITPSPTASVSISSTSSRTPSVTPSPTPSPSYSASPTASVSISSTSSRTPSVTPSPTPSPSPSASSTASVSISASGSRTATITVTISESTSPSNSGTRTPTSTVTPTITPTITETPSQSISATKTRSSSLSPSATSTATPSKSESNTRTISPSKTSSISESPSITATPSLSATASKTGSVSSSESETASKSPSQTASVSKSPDYSASSSISPSLTPSTSQSRSASRTASASSTPTKSPSRSASRSVGAPISTYQTICSFDPNQDLSGRTGVISIDQAFLNGWLTVNPNGACAHLATYDTEEEFNAILQSILDAGGKSSIIGGRRFSDSEYRWDAGSLRGKNWIEPWDNSTTGATFSRAACLQSFCLRNMDNALPVTHPSQVGMAVVITDRQNPQLVPSAGADCYTIEIASVSYIASVDGIPQAFQIVPAVANFDTHQTNAIRASTYLARVSNGTQNQWIKDELQCGTFNLWLGYETSTLTTDLRLSAGTNEGVIIQAAGQTVCSGYYCNLPATPITLTDAAVKFASTDGTWSIAAQSTTASALRAHDVCQTPGTTGPNVPVCVPGTSNNWLRYVTATQASTQVASRTAFYAGGPYQKVVGATTYLYYFDCRCQTDYRVNLACLGSANPSLCTVYTP